MNYYAISGTDPFSAADFIRYDRITGAAESVTAFFSTGTKYISVSPDERWILGEDSGNRGNFLLYDLVNGGSAISTALPENDEIHDVVWLGSSSRFVIVKGSSTEDSRYYVVYDLADDGTATEATDVPYVSLPDTNRTWKAVCSRTGRYLFTVQSASPSDNLGAATISRIDLNDGTLTTFTHNTDFFPTKSVTVSRRGQYMAMVLTNNTVQVIDFENVNAPLYLQSPETGSNHAFIGCAWAAEEDRLFLWMTGRLSAINQPLYDWRPGDTEVVQTGFTSTDGQLCNVELEYAEFSVGSADGLTTTDLVGFVEAENEAATVRFNPLESGVVTPVFDRDFYQVPALPKQETVIRSIEVADTASALVEEVWCVPLDASKDTLPGTQTADPAVWELPLYLDVDCLILMVSSGSQPVIYGTYRETL